MTNQQIKVLKAAILNEKLMISDFTIKSETGAPIKEVRAVMAEMVREGLFQGASPIYTMTAKGRHALVDVL